jgi:hypothetical protein
MAAICGRDVHLPTIDRGLRRIAPDRGRYRIRVIWRVMAKLVCETLSGSRLSNSAIASVFAVVRRLKGWRR